MIEGLTAWSRLDVWHIAKNRAVRIWKPYCDDPVHVSLEGRALRPDKRGDLFDPEQGGGRLELITYAPCRKCPKCLWVRQITWRKRMLIEMQNSPRTLLVTLTYSPAARERLLARVHKSGYGKTDPRLKEGVSKRVLDDVSSSLKRLRAAFSKRIDCKMRFSAVVEDHKDGSPHVHLLLHTTLTTKEVRKMRWANGFIDVRVCGADAATYVSKYLTKATGGIRASLSYGRGHEAMKRVLTKPSPAGEDGGTGREQSPLEGSADFPEGNSGKIGNSCILVSGKGTCDLESPIDVAAWLYAGYHQVEESMTNAIVASTKNAGATVSAAPIKTKKADSSAKAAAVETAEATDEEVSAKTTE